MKKFWLFFVMIVSSSCLISCNSDDDEPITKDMILGKWRLSKEIFNGMEEPLSDCELQMTIEFFENGTYSERDFEYDDIDDDCNSLPLKTGTWENLGNSFYFLSDIGVESLLITFSGNTMTASFSETVEGMVLELKVIFTKVD